MGTLTQMEEFLMLILKERRDAEEMSKQFLEAVEQGLIDPKDTKYPRHLRKLAE